MVFFYENMGKIQSLLVRQHVFSVDMRSSYCPNYKHINECINVSVMTLSVLAIFLSCFQYFKMTKIKSVILAKLRIIDLSVVTILVTLTQILAIANL